jgi:hypothetical protein
MKKKANISEIHIAVRFKEETLLYKEFLYLPQ